MMITKTGRLDLKNKSNPTDLIYLNHRTMQKQKSVKR